jgi:hypothetical protein
MLDALRLCATLELDGDGKVKGGRRATDDSLKILAKNVNKLANLAIENLTEIRWAGFEGKTKKVEDCTIFELALEGHGLQETSDVSYLQINGIAALWTIDHAITVAKNDGISLKFVEALSEAALFLSQAAMIQKDIFTVSAERHESSRKNAEFTDERSRKAAQNAAKRHANDPKQAEKSFIFECWTEWQTKPSQYASKAAFSRSMLEKCIHIVSYKVIADWCKAWELQQKGVGVPAQ